MALNHLSSSCLGCLCPLTMALKHFSSSFFRVFTPFNHRFKTVKDLGIDKV